MASGQSRRGDSKSGDRRRGGQKNRRGNRSGASVVLGLNALQNLRKKDPDDIVLDLGSKRCLPAFQALLGKTDMSPQMIELLVEVLARTCDNNSPENFNKLIVELPRSLFVILSLKCYITRLRIPGDTNGSPKLFIEHTVKLFSEILKRIPSAFETLPLGDLEQAVDILSKRGCVSGDVVQHVEQLKVVKEESLEKERRKAELEKQKRVQSRKSAESTGPPPEDFREMTIVPQHNDIFTDKQPYLRKNIVQGSYENLDHYLDVQFRLLREDFLRPLREGILNLVKYGIGEKQGVFKDILVYRNVKILYPVCKNKGLRHHIQFDNSRLKHIKWENSKRLIFGSLLCLSKDHFETFVFATVDDRDPKELVHDLSYSQSQLVHVA